MAKKRSGACRRSYRRKRKLLRTLYGDCCHWCGMSMEFIIPGKKNSVSVEHLIPLSQGGSNDYSNLRLVHRKCNK